MPRTRASAPVPTWRSSWPTGSWWPRRRWARDLYVGIQALGLDVEQIAGGHGIGLGMLADLKTNSGS